MSIPKLGTPMPPLCAGLQQEKQAEPETEKVTAAASVALRTSGNQPFVQSLKIPVQVLSVSPIQTSETDSDETNCFSEQGYNFDVSDSDSADDSNEEDFLAQETVFALDEAEAASPVSYWGQIGSRTGGY